MLPSASTTISTHFYPCSCLPLQDATCTRARPVPFLTLRQWPRCLGETVVSDAPGHVTRDPRGPNGIAHCVAPPLLCGACHQTSGTSPQPPPLRNGPGGGNQDWLRQGVQCIIHVDRFKDEGKRTTRRLARGPPTSVDDTTDVHRGRAVERDGMVMLRAKNSNATALAYIESFWVAHMSSACLNYGELGKASNLHVATLLQTGVRNEICPLRTGHTMKNKEEREGTTKSIYRRISNKFTTPSPSMKERERLDSKETPF